MDSPTLHSISKRPLKRFNSQWYSSRTQHTTATTTTTTTFGVYLTGLFPMHTAMQDWVSRDFVKPLQIGRMGLLQAQSHSTKHNTYF